MKQSAYRKPVDVEELGWLTTFPFPQRETAKMVADGLRGRYQEVRIEPEQTGFVVKYRGPRGRGKNARS
ncbi:hypothetical protein DNHGIG_14870 [Collibacillus ludicampi]|uniref:Uncharacterized protein n=1 Tax=Collibacillus ludicampi TaxID=2771369 RepID=A0AAV4LDU9_9BACL|nr:hypothetical protein [Collibacillus ludicampi]GIM45938.1 hypothetical protein DNHGIG_14870 [Collibacillus ludicampi]